MDTKFCTTCQSRRPVEGGYKKPNSTRGWMCYGCYVKKTPSIYQSKSQTKPSDISRLMTAMYGRAA